MKPRLLIAGEHVAIKFIPRGRYINKYVAREIVNHSHLLHPHIVQFKEVFLTADYLAIAMEYVAGGDMFAYVKRRGGLEEDEARWFFQQLIMALAYSHEIGVVNRDIKLENTLLNNGKRPLLKICDFGYSKNDKDSLPKSKVGTPGYTGRIGQQDFSCSLYARMSVSLTCMQILVACHLSATCHYFGDVDGYNGTAPARRDYGPA